MGPKLTLTTEFSTTSDLKQHSLDRTSHIHTPPQRFASYLLNHFLFCCFLLCVQLRPARPMQVPAAPAAVGRVEVAPRCTSPPLCCPASAPSNCKTEACSMHRPALPRPLPSRLTRLQRLHLSRRRPLHLLCPRPRPISHPITSPCARPQSILKCSPAIWWPTFCRLPTALSRLWPLNLLCNPPLFHCIIIVMSSLVHQFLLLASNSSCCLRVRLYYMYMSLDFAVN